MRAAVRERVSRGARRTSAPRRVWIARSVPAQRGLVVLVSAGTSEAAVLHEARIRAELLGADGRRARGRRRGWTPSARAGARRISSGPTASSSSPAWMPHWRASSVASIAAPVIGVPTSVGYGSAEGGRTALNAMLASCAAGVAVVGIDDGFGAGTIAARIARGRDDDRCAVSLARPAVGVPSTLIGAPNLPRLCPTHSPTLGGEGRPRCNAARCGDFAAGRICSIATSTARESRTCSSPHCSMRLRELAQISSHWHRPVLAVTRVERQGVGALHVSFTTAEEHGHRTGGRSVSYSRRQRCPSAIRSRALDVFRRLAEAEATVPRRSPEEVHFHELGAVDTLMDICGAIALLDELGIEGVTVRRYPLSRGHVDGRARNAAAACAGDARASARRRRSTASSGRRGARHADRRRARRRARLHVGRAAAAHARASRHRRRHARARRTAPTSSVSSSVRPVGRVPTHAIVLLETNLDDLSPELVPDAAAACFAAGALDVWTVAGADEEGADPGIVLSALARPVDEPRSRGDPRADERARRSRRPARTATSWTREERIVEVDGGAVRVKVGCLDGRVVNVAPEHDDCAELARADGRLGEVGLGGGARRGRRAMSRVDELERRIAQLGSAVVAFSGGVRLVARRRARRTARSANRALAVTAVSPALATGELDGARAVAERDRHRPRDDHHRRAARATVTGATAAIAATTARPSSTTSWQRSPSERGYAAVLSGANADDLGDWRPGLRGCRRARRRSSAPRGRCRQGRGARARTSARRAERREAGLAVPRVAHSLRHGGRPGQLSSDRPCRARAQSTSAFAFCASATTASSAASSSHGEELPRALARAGGGDLAAVRAPATTASRSPRSRFAPARSTCRSRRRLPSRT